MNYAMLCPLLSKEKDRIVRKPLDKWVQTLFRSFSFLEENWETEKFLAIANQLALILVYLGFPTHSQRLCKRLVVLFYSKYKESYDITFFEFFVQPFINLARLYSIFHKPFKALYIYSYFDQVDTGFLKYGGKNISTESISKNIFQVMDYVRFFEPLKTLISHDLIKEAVDFSPRVEKQKKYQPLFYEATVTLFILTNQSHKAFLTLNKAISLFSSQRGLFLLKGVYVYSFMKRKEEALELLKKIISPYVGQNLDINYEGLFFCSDVLSALTALKADFASQTLQEHLYKFSEYFYKKALEFQDEPLLLKVLSILSTHNQIYKKEFDDLKRQSYYLTFPNNSNMCKPPLLEELVNKVDYGIHKVRKSC